MSFDLATGAPQVIGDVTTPAVARTGTAAWVTADFQVVQQVVGNAERPALVGPPLPRNGLMRLSWESGGRWLLVSLGDPGGPLSVFALDTQDPNADWQPLVTEDAGETILAVAGETDTPDAVALPFKPVSSGSAWRVPSWPKDLERCPSPALSAFHRSRGLKTPSTRLNSSRSSNPSDSPCSTLTMRSRCGSRVRT